MMISIVQAINYQHQLEKHSSDINLFLCSKRTTVCEQNDHLPYSEERLGAVTIFTLTGTVHRNEEPQWLFIMSVVLSM